ncbi:helix-turn-helix domain-containing protein [Haloarcula halophila]|uniref:hypothetical protein n=1 Tax=Haloarcula TaxID=2237 RepID=UPI0023E3876E|nr:hypothetical protein [Halomicroarcula sp. DFY41]
MSDLPDWIETRIDRDLDKTLTQDHVAEVMVDAERPFFSTRQLQARVKPDVSKATVRNRLDELREIDVVATETYPDSVTLYYIDYDESDWPLSPEGKHALRTATPLDRLSIGFLGLSDTVGSHPTVVAGLLVSLVLFGLGGLASLVGATLLFDIGGLARPVGTLLVGACAVVCTSALQSGIFFLGLVATDRTMG